MCRVPIRCDTFRACYSFFNLLCQSRALSLFLVFSSVSFACVSLVSLSTLFSLLFLFLSLFSPRVNVAEVSPVWQPGEKMKRSKTDSDGGLSQASRFFFSPLINRM